MSRYSSLCEEHLFIAYSINIATFRSVPDQPH